jgi:hypothetical protein
MQSVSEIFFADLEIIPSESDLNLAQYPAPVIIENERNIIRLRLDSNQCYR